MINKSEQLQQLTTSCKELREENARLKALLKQHNIPCFENDNPKPSVSKKSTLTVEEKITLFRSLFRGREDIYALRWENTKKAKVGYSPACIKHWEKCHCPQPKTHCPKCNPPEYLPINDQVIYDHLAGKLMAGIYPLLKDESCWFVAVDFDKSSWKDDALAFQKTCYNLNVPAALERSQSGNGGHIWIFFQSPISACLARKLGCGLLTLTMQQRHQLSLQSYDRLFPNQDTMPKGGFGNLIAFPLQGKRREQNNSVFIDENFHPYPDQWSFLAKLHRLSYDEVNLLVTQFNRNSQIIDVSNSEDDEQSSPWEKKSDIISITEPLPSLIQIALANLVYIPKNELPPVVLNRLKKLAAFQNPEFYRAQAMRFSTYNKPRVIGCAEDFPDYLGLPRGCLTEVISFLKNHKIKVEIIDKTFIGSTLDINFQGNLRNEQEKVVIELLKQNTGVLAATTAFGKTVIAAWMIAARKVNTLILVHRQQLLEQWQEKLALFLNIPIKEIGVIGGGKNKPQNKIDIAMLQSLYQKDEINEIVTHYGQIIVDECHHISAFSFEQVMRQVKARFVLGLTATPIRKDGQHPIIFMQCGPIRYRVLAKDYLAQGNFQYQVKIRRTEFNTVISKDSKTPINDIYRAIIDNKARNQLIFNDVLLSLEAKRTPLLLTERTEHLDLLADQFKKFTKNLFVFKGKMSKKERLIAIERLKNIPDHEERLILAIGRYIGEGFDDPRLDTLFLTMPISWQGTLQQYLGRLHRQYANKNDVIVYDYVDSQIPMLLKMYQKRLKKYQAIGYSVAG